MPAFILGSLGFSGIDALFFLIGFVGAICHLIGGWMLYGKTVGKALLNLRIVDLNAPDVQGLTTEALVKRLVGWVALSIPFFLGFLTIIVNKDGTGFHDRFANTVVIQE